jgi:radical SAM additional 4Fe4S-binding domain
MKLRNLLHIQENDNHLIGSITPPFFFRVSEIMREFIQLCDNNTIDASIDILKEKYTESEFENFQKRLENVKDKLFVDDEYKETNEIDFSSKVHILTLNVTRKCNLKCDYCFEDSEYRKLGNMPFDIAKKAIDTFFTTSTNTPSWAIVFTGGEPLLNYDLLKKVVEYIDNRGLKVEYRIKTNATLMDDERMDFLIKNNFKIQISLDGNEKAHDTHRKFADGKGTFKIVNEVVKQLIEKNYGTAVAISGTLSRQTIKYIEDSYAYLNLYDKSIKYSLKPVMHNSKNQFTFNITDHQLFYEATSKNAILLKRISPNIFNNTKSNICGIGVWNIAIDVDGKIYPCYRLCGEKKYCIGDLFFLKLPLKLPYNISNIYKMEERRICVKCSFVNVCKTGCYVDKLQYNENECFQKNRTGILNLLINEFKKNDLYKYLEIV